MTVLVVEDDDISRLFLTKLLAQHECKVVEASNGREGLIALKRYSPDLVFLDVMMPVMDGFEMLETMRKEPEYAATPVVIMSAITEKEKILRLIQSGITDYLLKPIKSEQVIRRVEEVIKQTRTRSGKT